MKLGAQTRIRLVQVGFLLCVVLGWYVVSVHGGISHLLLPPMTGVFQQLVQVVRAGVYLEDLKVTVQELLAAFAIAAVCGTTTGYLVSRSRYTTTVLEPIFSGIYTVPAILFFPLYVLFLGLGPASKIAIGATIAFFPIVLNTIAGFINVDSAFVTAARSMGATNFQMFRFVLLPAAFPVVVVGLRMGLILAFLAVVGSETISSLSGLGHRIASHAESMSTEKMYVYIVFVIVIAFLLNTVVSRVERRAVRRWDRGMEEEP